MSRFRFFATMLIVLSTGLLIGWGFSTWETNRLDDKNIVFLGYERGQADVRDVLIEQFSDVAYRDQLRLTSEEYGFIMEILPKAELRTDDEFLMETYDGMGAFSKPVSVNFWSPGDHAFIP